MIWWSGIAISDVFRSIREFVRGTSNIRIRRGCTIMEEDIRLIKKT